MTEKAQTSAPKSPIDPENVVKSITDLQMTGLGSFSWLGTKWLENMSDLGSEWLHFVSERVQEDVKTQHEILHCKNVGEVQQIQARFLKKALDDYRDETGKMVEMCTKMMTEIQDKAKEQAEKAK
ncbi:MAG: phasin family protein [Pseudomonadota bacterium]